MTLLFAMAVGLIVVSMFLVPKTPFREEFIPTPEPDPIPLDEHHLYFYTLEGEIEDADSPYESLGDAFATADLTVTPRSGFSGYRIVLNGETLYSQSS